MSSGPEETAAPAAAAADAPVEFSPPADFVDVTGDGGVFKKVLKAGEDSPDADGPCDQDQVFVHYTGTLFGGARDGEKFDSSVDRGEPFSFKLGTGAVIKGWDAGVKTMRRGEQCELVLRPDYAYGKSGSGASIPPNAPLKFAIELLRWEGEDVTEAKDGGVVKHCLAKGEGYSKPELGAMVTVSLTSKQDSRTGVTFEVGLAEEASVPRGVELAVQSMVKGEKARVRMRPAYAECAVPAELKKDSSASSEDFIVYEVELVEFEKAKDSWEFSEEEKVAQAELLKAKGTEYFKRGKLRPALTFYDKVVDFLKWDSGFDGKPEELQAQRRSLLLAARLNLSLVHFKLGDHPKCIEEANEAIGLDASAAKAYFRRGQARMALRDYDDARTDFEKVAQLEPGNRAAAGQIAAARQAAADEKQRQKRTFFGMFDKFAKKDAAAAAAASATATGPADDQQQQQAKAAEENGGQSGDAAAAESST